MARWRPMRAAAMKMYRRTQHDYRSLEALATWQAKFVAKQKIRWRGETYSGKTVGGQAENMGILREQVRARRVKSFNVIKSRGEAHE